MQSSRSINAITSAVFELKTLLFLREHFPNQGNRDFFGDDTEH